jgi:hypothetical protein
MQLVAGTSCLLHEQAVPKVIETWEFDIGIGFLSWHSSPCIPSATYMSISKPHSRLSSVQVGSFHHPSSGGDVLSNDTFVPLDGPMSCETNLTLKQRLTLDKLVINNLPESIVRMIREAIYFSVYPNPNPCSFTYRLPCIRNTTKDRFT